MSKFIYWLQKWVVSWQFVDDSLYRANAIGYEEGLKEGKIKAFGDAQKDILETMADDLDKRAEELAKEKLSKLLSVVDERMIITFSDREKAVYIGGIKITDPGRLANMKAEAIAIESMDLWKVIHETPKKLAEKAMFVDDGVLENQLLKGRATLFMLDTQKRILSTLKSYTPPVK